MGSSQPPGKPDSPVCIDLERGGGGKLSSPVIESSRHPRLATLGVALLIGHLQLHAQSTTSDRAPSRAVEKFLTVYLKGDAQATMALFRPPIDPDMVEEFVEDYASEKEELSNWAKTTVVEQHVDGRWAGVILKHQIDGNEYHDSTFVKKVGEQWLLPMATISDFDGAPKDEWRMSERRALKDLRKMPPTEMDDQQWERYHSVKKRVIELEALADLVEFRVNELNGYIRGSRGGIVFGIALDLITPEESKKAEKDWPEAEKIAAKRIAEAAKAGKQRSPADAYMHYWKAAGEGNFLEALSLRARIQVSSKSPQRMAMCSRGVRGGIDRLAKRKAEGAGPAKREVLYEQTAGNVAALVIKDSSLEHGWKVQSFERVNGDWQLDFKHYQFKSVHCRDDVNRIKLRALAELEAKSLVRQGKLKPKPDPNRRPPR